MARAARFLWELEKRIYEELAGTTSVRNPIPALHFESWVRGDNMWQKNLHLGPSYAISSALLLGMAVISATLAMALLFVEHPSEHWIGSLIFVAASATLAMMVVEALSILGSPVLRRGQAA